MRENVVALIEDMLFVFSCCGQPFIFHTNSDVLTSITVCFHAVNTSVSRQF